jgi:hypothetical protein
MTQTYRGHRYDRQISPDITAMLTDFTHARYVIRAVLNVKTRDSGHKFPEQSIALRYLISCQKTSYGASRALPTRKSKAKTPFRHDDGQRAMSSTFCEFTFDEPARLKFHQLTFRVLRNLRDAHLVLALPK